MWQRAISHAYLCGGKRSSVGKYEVGYGKVPEHSKFKAGAPLPNPSGRGKGSKNSRPQNTLSALIREEGERTIEVKVRGKVTKMPTDQAIIRGILLSAAGGNSTSRCERPCRFTPKRQRTIISAPRSLGATAMSLDRFSRDFWRRRIFDFCNKSVKSGSVRPSAKRLLHL